MGCIERDVHNCLLRAGCSTLLGIGVFEGGPYSSLYCLEVGCSSGSHFVDNSTWKVNKTHCVKPFCLVVCDSLGFLLLSLNLCHCVVVRASISEKFSKWKVNLKDEE